MGITRRRFLGGLGGVGGLVLAARRQPQPAGAGTPPNVVVVMTDDQTVESLRVMGRTRALLGARGTRFATCLVSNPVCSPSRATFLSGQYSHNHGVIGNSPAFTVFDHAETLPVWLQRAGYVTAHVGKYLNGYEDATVVPPGWDEWCALVGPDHLRYYGYELSVNGTSVTAGTEPGDYQTDVLSARAVDLVGRLAATGRPFFLSVAPIAPHGVDGDAQAPVPAPRHAGTFASEPLPRPPSFDEADVADKPAAIRQLSRIGANSLADITARYRARLEALLAEDEAVDALVRALNRTGVLDRTLVVFTSDNGFFHGEHRIRTGKVDLYEPSVRVPLLARGPGFPVGAVVDQPVANVDLAATVVAVAGAEPGRVLDGVDLRQVAAGTAPAERPVLVETGPRDASDRWYQAVRTRRWVYAEHATGERELYDLAADPHQLVSRHDDPAFAQARDRLAATLGRLRACAGAACRARA